MQQLIIDTLKQQISGLQEQLALVESRAAEIKNTIEQLNQQLENLAQSTVISPQSHRNLTVISDNDLQQEETELPEVEVEFYVDDTTADDDELLTDEELEVEDTVEDLLVEEIEKEPTEVEQPTPAQPTPAPSTPPTVNSPTHQFTNSPTPPIDDIRKGMSLGDRFLFQRELFAGDGEKMNKTIDSLNQLSSLDEALQYVQKRFQWDTESQAYELFINLLRRRY